MESDSGEFIERTNFEEEESKLSRTFFMFVYSVVFHFDKILFIIFGFICRRDSMFRHFVWVRQPADADYVISIEYYSELLNHVSNKMGSPGKIYRL